jgi:hypothetical protein
MPQSRASKDLEFLRELQVTYEVAANGMWVCRVCGANDVFANTIKHHRGCRLREILGGEEEIKMPRLRGARPTPRHRLAAALPHHVITSTPPQFLWKPAQLSMWGNATYGDCVTAEEAFAKACHSPEIFILDTTVIAWAGRNNALDGADLTQIMDLMQTGGFIQAESTYTDGPHTAVDWTKPSVLCNAISLGPVKIAVAADQLENAVDAAGDEPVNGWLATGFAADSDVDHCVSLCGYGPMAWLFSQLATPMPDGMDGTKPGYGLFTWSSIGIIDPASLIAICGEAWLRSPTTIIS